MRTDVTRYRGSVRIGPVSLLVFVIIVCVAVMAMLALATANANAAFTARQASFNQDVYQNERTAQLFLSEVDATLSQSGEAGLRAALSDLAAKSQSAEGSQVTAAIAENGTLDATFEAGDGRKLVVQIATTDGGYTITKWNTDNDWKEDDSVKLWQG